MKKLLFLLLLLIASVAHAQLEGDEILQLHSGTTAEMNAMSSPQAGHIIRNTTTNTLWHYDGTNWIEVDKAVPTVYTGFFIIDASGSKVITGLPFQPSQITFVAQANIEVKNTDSGSVDADADIDVFTGSMNGFARKNNASTTQQVIFTGHSGRETGSPYVNHTSKYASDSHCIGIRYGDEEGANIGMLTASLTSFDSNGFTVNVTRSNNATNENLVVLYTAYK